MSDAALAGVPGGPRGGVAEPLVTRPFNVLGTRFECPVRYTLIKPIGQGAYGIVCSAHDNLTGEKVAIKKISSILDNAIDCKRTLREMKLLRHFSHENVIVIKDVYLPSSDGLDFQDVYTLKLVTDTIGTPSSEDIQYINSARARRYIESLPPKAKVEMGTLFPAASDVLRDLLDRMLIFDPRRRITVEEALEHPYLTSLHDPEDEPTCASVFYFPFEHQEPNAQQLRQLILEEFYVYYPHMRAVHSMHPKGYPP
ncbi:hypothetical protein I4F81_000304 [Pyropia yezoensis]|uniref:Uncharacterized protein n=1 Tax=Pyropia yezoensis TaxID=2788 RepID=A0ACC3BIF3_PYRYE|nr:hypothetical protein I4F81_000304 [Neopyropia yezoensis]